MEEIYKAFLSSSETLSEQFMRELFDLTCPEGPVLVYVDPNNRVTANHPSRIAFLHENPDQITTICRRIDDGDDPCVCKVKDGCVIGTQLETETTHCGYFIVFLPDYTSDFVHTNMDMVELLLSEAQIICRLIDKNNQLHHARLSHLTRTSQILS